MVIARTVATLLSVVTLQACATTPVGDPRFDLVTPLLGTWTGSLGTLQFKKSGNYALRTSSVTKGLWSPVGQAQLDVVSPKKETCNFAIEGNRLTIESCFLAGVYFRVQT